MKRNQTIGDVVGAWQAKRREAIEEFRPLYLSEIQRLAEQLRPRFESGELHACTDEDLELPRDSVLPHDRIEEACAERLGLIVDEDDEGDRAMAEFVLAVSPNAEAMASNWTHPCYWARAAACWDVILVARERGWYTPASNEQWMPGETADCGDHPMMAGVA